MDPFCYLCFMSDMLTCLSLAALWSSAEKGLLAYCLFCMGCFLVLFSHFPIWCPKSGGVFDCIDSRSLPSSILSLNALDTVLYCCNSREKCTKYCVKIVRYPYDQRALHPYGDRAIYLRCMSLRATGLRFFKIYHGAELNKIVDARESVQ